MEAALATAPERDRQDFHFTDRDFRQVVKLIYDRAGISLGESKRHMVYSRLGRRLRQVGLRAFADYLKILDDPRSPEWEHFTNALTTNLTSFFRESHHFGVLAEYLRDHVRQRGRFNIWCSASSTGEEPYSIAITAADTLGGQHVPVRILATDLDTKVLDVARRGVYAQDRVEGMASAQIKRHFLRGTGPNAGMVRVSPRLAAMVEFAQLNLLDKDWGMSERFDIVFCRNVMIYFDKPTQREILGRIRERLVPDGLLFAGHSESFLHSADLFKNLGRTIYRPVPA